MTTPISNASPPRLLKPVAGKIQNDGAAFAPLSPHKGVRNAVLIYEAIKHLPDQTLIRGDFDKKSRPLIYFPERPPKKVGKSAVDAVAARNIASDRAEFASFMKSIVDATFKAAPAHSPELRAAFDLRFRTLQITGSSREFTVGDIRGPLRSIAKSYQRNQLKKITSPHRTTPGADASLQIRRFKQFGGISGSLLVQLCTALAEGIGKGKTADAKALVAVNDMKKMLFEYRVRRDKEDVSFSDFLLTTPISRGAHAFAKLWLGLNGPDRNERTRFCTESWALEMDLICPMIVNAYRAAKQLREQSVHDEALVRPAKSPDVPSPYPDVSTEAPANTTPISPKPRALKRRFNRQASLLPVVGGSQGDALSPVLNRQSSVPRLRSFGDHPMRRSDSLTSSGARTPFQPIVADRASSTSATLSDAQATGLASADRAANAVGSTRQQQ